LLALLVGTALAVWLLVQPPASEGEPAVRPRILTPTVAVAGVPGSGTPQTVVTQPPAGPTQPPGAATTSTRITGTVTPIVSGTPTGTGTPAAGTYTVVAGDSLSGICSSQRPAQVNADCVANLRTLNSISGDSISVGQTLRLP
jgi:hypothetical protein